MSMLTRTQLGIYIESVQHEDANIYHNPTLLKINGVDAERLCESLQKVVELHPGISARIVTDEYGNPSWIMGETVQVEACSMPYDQLMAERDGLVTPFELENAPLSRLKVIETEQGVFLFVDFHHTLYDGYSLTVLLRDLDRILRGESPEPESVTIHDLSLEEECARTPEALAAAKGAYASLLAGAESTMDLPEDCHAANAEASYDRLSLTLGIGAGDFNDFARANAMPRSAVANAAAALLLSVLYRRDDVTFATIWNGRGDKRYADTFAMMVKTLPVRAAVKGDDSIAGLLAQVKENIAVARDNSLYSFAEAASDFGVNSDLLFAYQGDFLRLPKVAGEEPESVPVNFLATGSKMTLSLSELAGRLHIDIEYRSDLYTPTLVGALAQCYADILTSFVTLPVDTPLKSVPIMAPDAEVEQIALSEGGESQADPSATIPALFVATAAANPQKNAVIYKDTVLTYGELDRLSDALANRLRDCHGVGAGSVVGVLIERSELMSLFPLAVMKAGAAYMPLDPHFPADRLMFMIEDAGVDLILDDDGLAAKVIPEFAGTVIDASECHSLPECGPVCEAAPESPMVVLYTSGSTGKPKGVTLTQKNIVNYCAAYCGLTCLDASDRVGAYAAFGFDAHMMDLYPALSRGATVYVFDSEMRLDLTAMHDYMERQGITVMFMTTQIAWQMATLFEFSTLRVLSGGGEKLPPLNPLPYDFFNLYGPTECSVAATAFQVTAPTDGRIIGRSLPGYATRILDRWLRPVPQGFNGELVILGDGVGEGYLNRPELTAEKFITIDGMKAYRTGDQARFTADGEIEFLGRMDGLVKLRGLRIELGEIEAAASAHPFIKSFVASVKQIGGMENLVGYFTLKEGCELDEQSLREFMGESLTEFMIPSAMVQLDAMPLTPNGKVDRRALPVPEVSVSEIVAPESDAERDLFDIVADVLGHRDFGVTTNLLSVGLTSLMAMRLVASIMKHSGVKVTARTVMSAPTVREIAFALASASPADAQVDGAGEKCSSRRYYPLTENQRGVYIDWEMNRHALQYNIPQLFRFADGTDPQRLAEAVRAVVKAHPGLMTRIVIRDGDVMQLRSEDMIDVNVTLLSGDEIRESQACLEGDDAVARYFQRLVRPFDLLNEPLFRAGVYVVDGVPYLLLDAHHIIFDGVSAMVFNNELVKAYGGEDLAMEEYTALDRALDEKELMAGDDADKAREWFEELIGDSEPTAYRRSATPESMLPGEMGRVARVISSDAIKHFCADHGLTPSNYLLSAFMQLLHRLMREECVQIVTVNNGRADHRLLNSTGMFVKTLPVVSRCKVPDKSPAEFAAGVQSQFLTSQDYDFFPFTELVERHGVRPEIMYVFEGGINIDGNSELLKCKKIPLSLDTAKVPLTLLVFEPSEGEYQFVVEYDRSIFALADMQLLVDMMATLAQSLTSSVTVADATVISPEAEKALEQVRHGSVVDVPYKSFHGEMENRCDEDPDAPALVACDKRMTYREFDNECNRIANALMARGVQPGDRLVILLPRRSSLITAIYGAMKTGSAYIPCDPEYPADRIRLITEDSEARFIITTPDKVALYPGKAIDINELLSCTDESRPNVAVDPESVAYMIYTSGSTGRPKGVMIPHRAICNYLYGYWDMFYRHRPEVRTEMLIVTISFDASLNNLGCSLTSGHCLVLANEEECKDVVLLSKLMLENEVDSFDVTPSRLDAMLELPEFCEAVSRSKHLNIGGEGFGNALISKLFDAGFTGYAVNEYGPTETTVGSNQSLLTPGSPVVAGPPFYNDVQRIVDAWGGELPVGAVGELYIFGRGLGLGYNNLPEKTAEAYVDYHGERAYRTGDLAGWTPEGNVRIIGRIDHQVKLRGLRIELGEIESVAARFEGIKQVAATVSEFNKVQHLCLYYTTSGVDIDKDALKIHLAATLTEYMVPDVYMQIEEMPLTPNGKINRKALPEPVLTPLVEYVEPAEGLESVVAKAFERILGLERVGAMDDFFSIGGTSISAIKVVAALAAAGHPVTYKNVFEHRTPKALAAHVSGQSDVSTVEARTEEARKSESEFAAVLDSNTLDAYRNGELRGYRHVLLTGATGFMGIHMLRELLKDESVKVTCIVRSSKGISAGSRLRTLLFYYFDDTFDDDFASGRLTVVEGDVTMPIADGMLTYDIDCVINCAANVKHFSAGNDIEMVNVESVRNLVQWCLHHSARLIHISTVSVAGESVNGYPDPNTLLTEHMLDFGQSLANQYVSSKYEAERLVLGAVRDHGLDAKIMRVGNLSARGSDGEFQINFRSNAFMGRLRAYAVLGCAPYAALDAPCEFSPIDEVCRAILLLGRTPAGMNVFHPCNNHRLPLGDVLHILDDLGVSVSPVEMEEFDTARSVALDDVDKVEALQPLLAYESGADSRSAFIRYDASYTNQVLYRLGFRWNYTSHDYVEQFLRAIKGLDFFEI